MVDSFRRVIKNATYELLLDGEYTTELVSKQWLETIARRLAKTQK